jgi:hypothetical protein
MSWCELLFFEILSLGGGGPINPVLDTRLYLVIVSFDAISFACKCEVGRWTNVSCDSVFASSSLDALGICVIEICYVCIIAFSMR